MKSMLKLTALLLAVLLALSALVGCGKKAEWPVDETTGLVEFKIGGIGPLTGDYAIYGVANKQGALLAMEEINAAGGVNGFKLVVEFQDSQGDQEKAVSAFGALLDAGMKASLGGTLSGETEAIVAAAKDSGMLTLTPTGSAKKCIQGSDSAFRICFNDPQQGEVSADYIADHKLATKVAVFYQSDNDYSVGLYETFNTEAAVKNLEIVTVQTFTNSTSTDFSTQINAIKDSGADLVFLPIYTAEAAKFLSAANEKLSGIRYFGCDGLDGILDEDGLDPKWCEGLFLLTPFLVDSTEENVVNFVKNYKAKYGQDPSQFAADGYDAIYTIAEAIKQADIKPDNTADLNSRLVAAMTKITVKGVTGTMTWSADGECQKAAQALVIKDSKYVAYED